MWWYNLSISVLVFKPMFHYSLGANGWFCATIKTLFWVNIYWKLLKDKGFSLHLCGALDLQCSQSCLSRQDDSTSQINKTLLSAMYQFKCHFNSYFQVTIILIYYIIYFIESSFHLPESKCLDSTPFFYTIHTL